MKNTNTDIQASNRIISIINNSKEQYERIINDLENAYVVINERFEILDANKRFASTRGSSFLRADLFSYVYPGSFQLLKQEIQTVIKTQTTATIELKLISGRSFLFVISILNVSRVEEGVILKLLGADITELREREGLIMDVFRTVTVGLLVVDGENKVLNGFSQYTKIILEESNLTGHDIYNVFFNRSLTKFSPDEIQAIARLKTFNGTMPKDDFVALMIALPKMLEIPSTLRSAGKRIIQITYEAIIEDGLVIKYLMILQDMSDYVDINPPTINDDMGKLFKYFDVDSETLIAIFDDLQLMVNRLPMKFESPVSDSTKGVLHSIKGMLRMVGINYLAGLVHQIEDQIKLQSQNLPSNHEEIWVAFLAGWNRLSVIYKIAISNLTSIPAPIENAPSLSPSPRLQKAYESYGFHPILSPAFTTNFSRFDSSLDLNNYCLKLIEKNSIDFSIVVRPKIETDPFFISQNVFVAIKSALIHFINNSFAHGFSHQTPNEPNISIKIGLEGSNVVIDYVDNGAGVDVNKLRSKLADVLSVPSIAQMSDKEVADHVFLPGLSTKDSVDEVAGRGIGLSGAISDIKMYGGNIELVSYSDGVHFKIKCDIFDQSYKQLEVVSAISLERLFEYYFSERQSSGEGFRGLFTIPYPLALHQALEQLSSVNEKSLNVLLNSSVGDNANQVSNDLAFFLLSMNGINGSLDLQKNMLICSPKVDLSQQFPIEVKIPIISNDPMGEILLQLNEMSEKLGVQIQTNHSIGNKEISSQEAILLFNRAAENRAFLMLNGV